MVDKPIIFSGPMVRALLDGRKTQTRRALKPQPSVGCDGERPIVTKFGELAEWRDGERGHRGYFAATCKPWFHPSDRLWVRETWSKAPLSDHGDCAAYRADGNYRCGDAIREGDPIQWRSPIFMPRKYSRLTLIVTDVRVQRLQEIREEDATAEGVSPLPSGRYHCGYDEEGEITCKSPVTAYAWLWNSLNAKRGYSWDSNPWVCALKFDVIKSNIDAPTSAAGM